MILYISKNENELKTEFVAFIEENNIKLIANSMIEFKAASFSFQPDQHEAYFFGSKRAVSFFLQQHSIPHQSLICCIGNSTAESLKNAGYQVDFIGNNASDAQHVAQDLVSFLGDKKLCVVRSNISMRSIPKAFPSSQVNEICVYETALSPKKLEQNPDVLIFTSPSNVDGFLLKNEIKPHQQLIAWGKTTQNHLETKGHKTSFTLKNSDENEIIAFLHKQL